MKKLLFAIFLTFLYSVSAYGQVPTNIPNTVIQVFPGAPTGACLSVMIATRQDTGAFYDCFGGVWTPVGGAGAGANSSLSNLSNPTAVNQSLIPGTTGLTLGSLANPWANIFIQSLTFPGLEVGFFCFPGTLPTPPTGYGGLGCIDSNGLLDEYNIGASAWQPLVNGGTANQFDVSATTGAGSLDPVLIFPGTASGKVISGVSYSALYTGATLDVRVNATAADASALTNGNTSHAFSSVGEPSGSSIAAPITVPSDTEWILPIFCNWQVNMGGQGGVYAITQDVSSTIWGPGYGFDSCRISSNSGGYEGMYATSGVGRFRAEGFHLSDGSHSMLGGTLMAVSGVGGSAVEDASYFGHIMVENQAPANAALTVGNACCGTTFENVELDGVDTGGIQLILNGTYDVIFRTLSADHPLSTNPIIKCENNSVASIFGLYEEPYPGAMTSPVNDNSGCLNLAVYGQTVNPLGSGAVSPFTVWQIESGTTMSFVLQGLQASQGNLTGPMVAVNNIPNSTSINVDAYGNLSSYSNNTSYVGNLADLGLTPSAALVCTTAASVLTTSGCGASIAGGVLGSAVYQSAPGTSTVTAANTSATTECLTETGTGSVGAAPLWGACSGSAATAWSAITSGANAQTGAFSTAAPWTFSAVNGVTVSAAGTASTPNVSITGLPFAGTATTSIPNTLFGSGAAASSWSTGGTYFGADCASGFAGNVYDQHANGGASTLSWTCAGAITSSGAINTGGAISSAGYSNAAAGNYAWFSRSLLQSPSNGTIKAINNSGGDNIFQSAAFQSIGTTFTASGCSNSTLVGGASAGSYDSGTSGTCTVVVTTGITATSGYACSVWDVTTNADLQQETAYTATTVTFSGTTVSGDKIVFGCTAF